MKSSLDEFVSVVDRLASRLDELESRVFALEHPPAVQDASSALPAMAAPSHPLAKLSGSTGLMPVVGRVFLGIAGAYLLRALAETGLIPQWLMAVLGLAYVCLWLLQAARTSLSNPLAGSAYAITSAVILSPMLWELTLRFKVTSPASAATVLVLYVAVAAALGWKRKLAPAVVAPTVSSFLVAAALFVATRDPLPFTVALLVIALLHETASHFGRWPGLRPLAAIFADLAFLALIAIYTGRDSSTGYQSIAPEVLLGLFAALFGCYASSALFRTVWQQLEIGVFDTGQAVASFLLALLAALRITGGRAAVELGAFCLLLAAACYVLVFWRFAAPGQRRNYHVFSTWAAALLLAGSFLCLSDRGIVLALGVSALAATFAGMRSARLSLAFHGAVYLVAGAVISGLLTGTFKLLFANPPASHANPLFWTAGAFIAVCYLLVWRSPAQSPQVEPSRDWPLMIVRLCFATLAACTALALAITVGLSLLPAVSPSLLAAMRTLAICLIAVVLGWSGSSFRRSELNWLAYSAIALCTFKLLFEDLRNGNAAAIAFSLFCYGMVWLLVPRLVRSGKQS